MDNGNEISRVTRTREDAVKFYNRISKYYNLLTGSAEFKLNLLGLRKLKIEDKDVILEIGFGTGKIINEIANLENFHGNIYGIDLSEGMLKKAKSLITTNINKIHLKCGDAMHLPYENSKFDKLFMSFTLELFDTPELPIILDECRRVLKPGGKICIISMSKRKVNFMVKLYELFHQILPKTVDCRPIYTYEILIENNFKILEYAEEHIFTLPVDIVIASS